MFRLTLVNLIPMKRLFKIKGLNRNFLIMIRKFSHRTVSVFESKIRVAFFYYYYCLHNFSGIMFAIKVIFKYIYIYIFKFYFTILKKEGIFSTVAASMHHPVRKTLQVCLTE